MTKKYVHEGKEVELTGRKASKPSRSGINKDYMFEIKPLGATGSEYNKWVRMTDLFEIAEGDIT